MAECISGLWFVEIYMLSISVAVLWPVWPVYMLLCWVCCVLFEYITVINMHFTTQT